MDTQYRPHSYGIGLLATVTSLPSFHYDNNVTTSSKAANEEIPLDLSKKVTTLSSPLKKRYREELFSDENEVVEKQQIPKIPKTELTPNKQPVVRTENSTKVKSSKPQLPQSKEPKRTKVSRKLKFDEDKSSPVSGTIIRPLEEIDGNIEHESGDIDPQYNIVEATDEARAEIAAIPNVIGDYKCKLCRIDFEDVFELARHRCSCIVLLEYRCPECGKKFNCPANLASHRRWHKPREQVAAKNKDTTNNDENQHPCAECGKSFKRMAYLKKHQATHIANSHKNKKRDNNNITNEDSKDSQYSQISSHSNNNNNNKLQIQQPQATNINNNMILYSYAKSSSSSSMSDILYTISAAVKNDDTDDDSCDSSDSQRLHIIADRFTEDENIAAAALAHLRHGSTVIKHTALAV